MVRARGDDETATANNTQRPAAVGDARAGGKYACLMVAFEGARPRAAPSRHWLTGIDQVSIGRRKRPENNHSDPDTDDPAGARSVRRDGGHLRVRVSDPLVSAGHARLRRDGDRWVIEDRVIAQPGGKPTNGTFVHGRLVDRNPRPLVDQDVIVLGRTAFVFREVELAEVPRPGAQDVTAADDSRAALATLSPALDALNDRLAHVVASDLPIVILGEPGTGKELLARAIHRLSRRKGQFVGVNCSALPATVIETSLFGHVKGAFSGAENPNVGLVRTADGGTLLLDEIGELANDLQPKLLRMLQEREVLPVGGNAALKVDVRVVAATNRDMRALVVDGRFRPDLWQRLTGVTITVPPLRARKEDLGLVLGHLLRRHEASACVSFSPAAVTALFVYRWPGNIRELEMAVKGALLLANPKQRQHRDDEAPAVIEIGLEHLPAELQRVEHVGDGEDDQKARLMALLAKHDGNVAAVAKEWHAADGRIGVTPEAIRKKCRSWRIVFGRELRRNENENENE